MRVIAVPKLTPSNINDRRLTLRNPKSGREEEFIFIPQRIAGTLRDQRNICYLYCQDRNGL
jgi:integrase/recombinase XerD